MYKERQKKNEVKLKAQHLFLAMALFGSLRLTFRSASESGKRVQTEWGKQMTTESGIQMTTGSGILMTTGSGIQMTTGSGIQLESASGIQFGSGSGNLFHPVSGISEIIYDESDLTDGEVFLTLEVAVEPAQLFDELMAIVNE